MTVFDLLDAPLEGSNLIEAGAGTGKTHNIVGLFVRLVVEKELCARDILVVTYTIAATEEGPVRRRLVTEKAPLQGEGRSLGGPFRRYAGRGRKTGRRLPSGITI